MTASPLLRLCAAALFAALLLPACKGNDGASNPYKNARKHPSETIEAEHKKGAKKARKDFKKQLKKNEKAGSKRQKKIWKNL